MSVHCTRVHFFKLGNTNELPLADYEQVVREGVRTTSNEEMRASTKSPSSNLVDSSDSDEISPYAILQNTDVNPGVIITEINPAYAILRNPAIAGSQTTTATSTQNLSRSDHPPARAQYPNPRHMHQRHIHQAS